MKKHSFFIALLLFITSCSEYSILNNYKVIAHRGCWKLADGADNSIMGLKEAARLGVDGVELDICKTKDDSLVVIHGMYHGDYYIPETEYRVLKSIKLSNGENIPTLRDYMSEAAQYDMTYFLDIKSPNVEIKVLQVLYQYNCHYKAKIICSSFEMCEVFLRENPNLYLVYNRNDKSFAELNNNGFCCVLYEIREWKSHLEMIKEARSIGLELSACIAKSESDIIWCASNGINYIIADNPLEAIQFRSNYE